MITETALPHKCVSCRRDADGRLQFIDFNVSFDYEGAIQMCMFCAQEMARTIGFVSEDDMDQIVAPVAGLEEALEAERERNNELATRLDAFNSVFGNTDGSSVLADLFTEIHQLRTELSEKASSGPTK